MPNHRPWSEYVHCNNNMLANLNHNASALFWYTQRHHRSKGHGPWLTNWGYCAQPPRFRSHCKQASPLQEGARSTSRGLRVGLVVSFGRSFVWGAKLRIADPSAGRRRTMSGGNLTQSSTVRPQDARPGTLDHGPCASDLGALVLGA